MKDLILTRLPLHFTFTVMLVIALSLSMRPAHGEDANELSGIPLVLDSSTLMIGGHKIHLWGIDPLAGDQQCWQGRSAWACGEQATTALKHFVENHVITCRIKNSPDGAKKGAQCFRPKGPNRIDVAHYLVKRGWAMDRPAISDGLYAMEQSEAQKKRRGIWTSRFQTAANWRDGVQQFVDYNMVPPPEMPLRATAPSRTEADKTTVTQAGKSR